MECTSWRPPSPRAAGRTPPTPKLSSSGLLLINLSSFSYVFLEVFVFPESISDGWVALWGGRVTKKTPKMLAPTPEAPSSLPSNTWHTAPGGLMLKRGSGRHANWSGCPKMESAFSYLQESMGGVSYGSWRPEVCFFFFFGRGRELGYRLRPCPLYPGFSSVWGVRGPGGVCWHHLFCILLTFF